MTTRLMLFLYQLLLLCGGPLYLGWRLLRGRRSPGLKERLAWYPGPLKAALSAMDRPIWIHLVSVGEVLAAGPFIRALRQKLPGRPWLITTTTPPGRALAGRLIRQGQDRLLFLPWDLSPIIGRALRLIRPRFFFTFETELWPVLFHRLGRAGVPIAILNGRISPVAYRRYLWIRPFMERALAPVRFFFTQTAQDSQRYAAIGAAKDRIVTTGNLKWDLEVPPASGDSTAAALGQRFKPQPDTLLWTAGSTHPGEERILLEAYSRLKAAHPNLRMLVAPRHPERVAEVEQEVRRAGLIPLRRTALERGEGRETRGGGSQTHAPRPTPHAPQGDAVILLDTLGELTAVYRVSDIVFIGGSLVPHGGHNLVEPALFQRPILAGPNLQNFQAIAEALERAGGLAIVRSAQELEQRIQRLLEKPALRAEVGQRAYGVLRDHRGATERTLQVLMQHDGSVWASES